MLFSIKAITRLVVVVVESMTIHISHEIILDFPFSKLVPV